LAGSSAAGEPGERFAALIAAERTPILASYAASLEALHSSLVASPSARDQAMTDASCVLADVAASLRGSASRSGDPHETLAGVTGQAAAGSQVSLADLLRAAAALFDVTVSSLARYASDDPRLLPWFVTAILALNEGIASRLREATHAHTGYLLERIDQAHIDERHRIARDLHDRLGEGMSVALRQLEMHEQATMEEPAVPSPWAAMAKDALAEAMRRLRVVTSDLRQDSIRSLETALVLYIDSAAADADVRLRVSGDERWAPPAVIEEAFLIIREAIRNALRHGVPRLIVIGVALAPHELHAWVEDDGSGFVPAEVIGNRTAGGAGLATMGERTDLIGGRLAIASLPGQGTQVDLLVPLPGRRDERR
jgi:signal transduction histidine kinase